MTAIVSRLEPGEAAYERRRHQRDQGADTELPGPRQGREVRRGGEARRSAWTDQASDARVRTTSMVSTALRGSRSTRRPLRPWRSQAVTARHADQQQRPDARRTAPRPPATSSAGAARGPRPGRSSRRPAGRSGCWLRTPRPRARRRRPARASSRLIQARESSTVTTVTRVAAGRIRRARRAQNAADRDPPGEQHLAVEEAGDEVAGDDEEDVDADEAAGQERDAGVGSDDCQDCDRAQPLDVPAELSGHRLGRPCP